MSNIGNPYRPPPCPAHFIENPHIALPTRKDFTLQLNEPKTTFPEPLPNYLHRNTKILATSIPVTDPVSADAGRFSFSIKGMRRDLRRAGYRAEHLVREVEAEILEWLDAGGITLNPDAANSMDFSEVVGRPVSDTGSIIEVFRTPQLLIWRISDDAFARYVVHCCARYHNVVSFSTYMVILLQAWNLPDSPICKAKIFRAQGLRISSDLMSLSLTVKQPHPWTLLP